jgi:hypothetical protein
VILLCLSILELNEGMSVVNYTDGEAGYITVKFELRLQVLVQMLLRVCVYIYTHILSFAMLLTSIKQKGKRIGEYN